MTLESSQSASFGGSALHSVLKNSKVPGLSEINPFDRNTNLDYYEGVHAANQGIRFKIGDSDSYVSINLDDLSFGLGGNIDSPCSFTKWIFGPLDCAKKISVYAQPSVKLGGSLTLEVGDDVGSFKLARKTLIPTEGVTYPAVPGISAGGKFGASVEADLVVDEANKNKDYEFSFSVESSNRFSLSAGNGFEIKPIKNEVTGEADPITGLEFDASILPTLSAVIEIGETIAGYDLDLASINGDIIPKEIFRVSPGSGSLGFDVLAGASADFLKVLGFSGYHYDIAQTSLYSTSIDLW